MLPCLCRFREAMRSDRSIRALSLCYATFACTGDRGAKAGAFAYGIARAISLLISAVSALSNRTKPG
jgi:hypothetical protein